MGTQRRSILSFFRKFREKNNKQVRFSVSLKITLVVVLLSILVISTISLINFYVQQEYEREQIDQKEQNKILEFVEFNSILKEFEEYISVNENLNDKEKLQGYIIDLKTQTNKNLSSSLYIRELSIYLPIDNELQLYVSTDKNKIDSVSVSKLNNESFRTGDPVYITSDKNQILKIISPISSSNEIAGTYEMSISIPQTKLSHEEQIKIVILISFIGMIFLVISLVYILRKIIVNPIIDFKNKSKMIARGNLDTHIDIKSKDEIGELARAFNDMVLSLKESVDKIEYYTHSLKENRDKIKYYNTVLEKILEQKDKFIGQLGHDLKNPLQPLTGLLPILINQEENPQKKETLEVMYQNVLYMQDLISDTLKLARLRSDNIEFNFQRLNLREQVEKIISSQKMKFIENKIKIENEIDKEILVWADQLRLYEVFQNIISNSVKYTPKSGGVIRLKAEKINDETKVIIKDTGVGMTREQVKRIFDEFYKADQKTSDYHSTGLGLAICKRIIEKHGGKIWAESPGTGEGSKFYFTLKSAN